MNKECPCELCDDCNFSSHTTLKEPCPWCLSHHSEYDDYDSSLTFQENKEYGNIE